MAKRSNKNAANNDRSDKNPLIPSANYTNIAEPHTAKKRSKNSKG
jgi:hypothetical protein